MAPRKRGYLEDGYSSDSASSSSSLVVADGGDLRRRRRRRNGKEDAMLGIFGDEGQNEQQGGVGRTVRGVDGKGNKVDYLRGQAFVKAGEGDDARATAEDSSQASQESEADDEEDGYSAAEEFAKLAATEQEELETRNPFAGAPTAEAASTKRQADNDDGFQPASFTSSRAGIGSSNNGGLGSARAGIGSSTSMSGVRRGIGSLSMFQSAKESVSEAPSSAFAAKPSTNQDRAMPAQQAPPKISFKTGGKFDPAKYLAQMGWSGGGLGKQGEGIVNPIEVKQRPERAGIAFGGLKEKTKQAKDEARRRGEDVSTDEDERARRRKGESKAKQKPRKQSEQAWTKSEKKPRKPKIEHRTYEQIVEELGHAHHAPGVGMVIDASGKEFTSISAALAQHAVPTADTSELLETRHNLRLLCETNRSALEILANEGAAIKDRRKWLDRDIAESSRRLQSFKIQEERTQAVLLVVQGLERMQKEAGTLEAFIEPAEMILLKFPDAITEFHLDEALAAALMPTFKLSLQDWQPLQDPVGVAATLEAMVSVLKPESSSGDTMSPYESMIWNIWMPAVRTALNNEWDVRQANQATELFRVWANIVPAFVRDNISQQLILPKIMAATSDWNGKEALYKIIFPWMPLLGDQLDQVLDEAKRRIRATLRSFKVYAGVPEELKQWRDVFRKSEWDSMLLHHVVEKLSAHLDAHFAVNVEAQDLKPLEDCMAWKPLMSDRMFNKLLAARVIPKLIKALHLWLTRGEGQLQDVAQWYEHWKAYFDQHHLGDLQAVRVGMQTALKMMEQALQLGDSDRQTLELPDMKTLQHAAGHMSTSDHRRTAVNTTIKPSSSFKQIIEHAAAERDLLVQPLNKTELRTGHALFRLSRAIDGRNGKTFYVDEDVPFVLNERSSYDPVSLTDLLGSVA